MLGSTGCSCVGKYRDFPVLGSTGCSSVRKYKDVPVLESMGMFQC